jgi:hypothetical protein
LLPTTLCTGIQPAIAGAEGDVVVGPEDPAAEAQDCVKCLGPGFMRKCCGEFLCNQCFYRLNACPCCGTPCIIRGFEYEV